MKHFIQHLTSGGVPLTNLEVTLATVLTVLLLLSEFWMNILTRPFPEAQAGNFRKVSPLAVTRFSPGPGYFFVHSVGFSMWEVRWDEMSVSMLLFPTE